MSTSTQTAPALTGARKAAIVLASLGEQASAEVIKKLKDSEVQLVSESIARLGAVSAEEAREVLEELHQVTAARNYVARGGIEYARRMLTNAFGPEASKRLIESLPKDPGKTPLAVEPLEKIEPQRLARMIQNEHPQTIAVMLAHFNPAKAAGVMRALPAELRSEVAVRIANLDQISPEIVARVAAVIGERLGKMDESRRQACGGVRAAAALFNQLDQQTSDETLQKIEESDPQIAETIRNLLFVFEDLLTLDQNAIREITSRIDRKLLTVALKGTSDQLRDHILQTLSQRGAAMLKEDMEALGPVKIKEVQAAQQQMLAVVVQLQREGVIGSKGGSDEYVV